jgi:hypothetical protein
MSKKILDFFIPPAFSGDEEKTRQACALAVLILGSLGVLSFFEEKFVVSMIVVASLCPMISGFYLNQRGLVKASGMVVLVFLWITIAVLMIMSSGMQSLAIMFFVSRTVIAGIVLGARCAYIYAGSSLLTGLGFILVEKYWVSVTALVRVPVCSCMDYALYQSRFHGSVLAGGASKPVYIRVTCPRKRRAKSIDHFSDV